MFCKWCGGNLTPSDSKCKRCGKEVPALSDCGGFYDLVPNAKKLGEAHPVPGAPVTVSGNVKHQPEPQKDTEPLKTKKNSKRASWNTSALTLLGIMIVLVVLFVMNGKINQYSDDIERLQGALSEITSDLDAIEAKMESPEEIEPDEMTGITTSPVNPEISEQDISFTFEILNQRNTKEYLSDFDLGECSNAVSVTHAFDDETKEIVSVVYAVENAGQVELGFRHESESQAQNVSVTYKIDESAFGLSAAPETCVWEYRVGSKGNWLPVSEDIFTQTGISGETRLSVIESGLDELVDNSEEALELRCKISRTNTDDGSVTLFIEGISFYQDTNNETLAND